jgi:hypothetical protein
MNIVISRRARELSAKSCYTQTKVIGTEVIFADPGAAQWGLKNILDTLFITPLIRSNCLDE